VSEKAEEKQVVQVGKFGKFIEDWSRIQGMIGGSMLLLLTLFISYSSLARYGLRISVPGMIEIPSYAFLISIALAAAFTLQIGGHIRVTMLIDKCGPKNRKAADIFGFVMTLIFCGFLGWAVFVTAQNWTKQNQLSTDLEIPLYVLMFIVTFGFFTLCMQLFVEIYKAAKHIEETKELIKE
jgi:TRAP-type C4-dicarboxylate transport system permease small subunit